MCYLTKLKYCYKAALLLCNFTHNDRLAQIWVSDKCHYFIREVGKLKVESINGYDN